MALIEWPAGRHPSIFQDAMDLFVDIVLTAPTVVFTLGLGIALLYWTMVILGAVDIEMFDVADGVLDGALDSLDGALDGAEAAVEGAVDGASEGAAEAASSGLSPLVFLANILRIGRVPLTVSLSAFTLWGWLTSFCLTWLFFWLVSPVSFLVFVIASLLATAVVAAALTNVSVRPLEPIFESSHGRERRSLLGEQCVVTTGRVDAHFGQATTTLQSDDLLFQVRCDTDNPLRRGDIALIVHWDEAREAFVVEPLAPARIASERPVAPNPPLSPISEV